MDFSKEYDRVCNSVIRVLSVRRQGSNNQIKSTGSGVLIDDGTKALTCSHCIAPDAFPVVLLSGQKNNGQIAKVIFNDPTLDIAILEFVNPIGLGVALGNSDNMRIGHEAFLVGFPFYTSGITALAAHIAGFESINGIEYLKIDASVNHGNSGGPLFNLLGELVGIINAKSGSLSAFLNQVEQNYSGSQIIVGGINAVEVLKQLISEMKKNLNLGTGNAVPLRAIADKTNIVRNLLA